MITTMSNACSKELGQEVIPTPDVAGSIPKHEISRRSFLNATAVGTALFALGCEQSKSTDDLKSSAQIDALNNRLSSFGWSCVQMRGYSIVGFVYDDKGEYSRTVFAHPDGKFTIHASSQKDSRAAGGTPSIETRESESIEKFNNVDEAAAYIASLDRSGTNLWQSPQQSPA